MGEAKGGLKRSTVLQRLRYNSNMTLVSSFPPIEGSSAHVLILGSMPGVASLNANQYYAHPQNAFWKIIGTITGCPDNTDYAARIAALKQSGIAVWDVLESCIRPGSLDADIDTFSVKANNIAALIDRHPEIKTICFNGGMAEKIFNKHVLPTLKAAHIRYIRLPSTSPAHAGMTLENKIAAWRAAI